MKQVFISYTTRDLQRASAIRKMLEDHDISCWMGDKDIHASNTYTADITKAIEQCQVFILVLSSYSQESPYVLSEFECAISKRKTIIPFIIENFRIKEEFYFHIRQRQAISAFEDWKEGMNKLLQAVNHLLLTKIVIHEPQENLTYDQKYFDPEKIIRTTISSDIIDIRYGDIKFPVKDKKDGTYQFLCYHCEKDLLTDKQMDKANKEIESLYEDFSKLGTFLIVAIIFSLIYYFVIPIEDFSKAPRIILLTIGNPFFWAFCTSCLLFLTREKENQIIKNVNKYTPKYGPDFVKQTLYCESCKKTFTVKVLMEQRKQYFYKDVDTKDRRQIK